MKRSTLRLAICAAAVLAGGLLAGCGGGISHNTSPGSTAMTAQASGATPFSANCGTASNGFNETFTAGSSVQPQIAVVPGGNLVGIWEQDRWSGIGTRGILLAHSADGGATWSAAQTLQFSNCGNGNVGGVVYDRASDPWITLAGNGVLYASAIAFSASGFTPSGFTANGLSAVLVSKSTDSGVTWSAPQAVIQDNNPSSSTTFYFNDRDSITADPASGIVYLVWDRINSSKGTSSEPAWLARSVDGGSTWSTAVLYDPGVGTEAFNNEIVILPNGTVLDFFTLLGNVSFSSTLQMVSSADHGVTWTTTAPVTVSNIVADGTTNPITGGAPIRDAALLAQVAADPASGNVAAVWQQSFTSGAFDGIALSVSTNGGTTWSAPKQINGVTGVAAFDPSVRYLPNGVIAVAYYDLRDYMSGSSVLSTSVWLTESADGGATWHELRLQGPFDLNRAPLTDQGLASGVALFLGDNQGLAQVSGNALPLYAATDSGGSHIYATRGATPLTSSGAHVYSAAAARPVTAAAAARARALVEQRLRARRPSPTGQP